MRRAASAAAALALAVSVLSGCGSGGSERSGSSLRLGLYELGPLTGCTGYGHSGIEGYGVPRSDAFVTLVCDRETGSVLNLGIGGSTLQGQLTQMLGLMPSSHATQLAIVMWGENDLALFGPGLGGYAAGLRMLVSRLRTPPQNVHPATDSALSYTGPWSQAAGEQVLASDGSFTWTSPRGFQGGEVAFTATFRRALGARYAFSLDGKPAGVWDTRGLGQPPPAPSVDTPGAYRIKVPPGAGHVVRCRITDVHGGADLLGWQLESSHPPLVVLVEPPHPPSFQIYDASGWRFHPQNSQVFALARAMGAVAREFDGYVITVDPEREIGGRKAYFLSDQTHFNVAGNAIIARLIERAIAADPHVRFSR
jgi:lysophospholipase L1-like esterase